MIKSLPIDDKDKKSATSTLKNQSKNKTGAPKTQGVQNTPKTLTAQQKSNLDAFRKLGREVKATTAAATARQSMMASRVATSVEGGKWYKGDLPTLSETVSRIYDVGTKNQKEASIMMRSLSALQDDPTSIFYNPYAKATNKAISAISELGIDVSGGITDDWIAKHSYLKGSYRTESTYSPLAPAKKSTDANDAAYWYYKILQAEDNTKKAEQEWAALQEEITYWAKRVDRNYSDDEILGKIDWDDYKTLQKMDEQKAMGVPETFNREIGYSQDALKGVIWAARNGSTGNALDDSVNAVRGVGRQWTDNADVREALDPSSVNYSPYKVGSTIDDAALYFNVSAFDKNWLDENRAMLASGDETKIKMYQKVYKAETFTQQAESELESLQADIDRYLSLTSDPDRILNNIKDKYSALEKLDESMQDGDLIDTTRAIDYRWQDIEAQVRKRCEEQNTAVGGQEFADATSGKLGIAANGTQSGSAVNSTRDNAINAAGSTIADSGTDAEKVVFKNAYSSDFETCITQINAAVNTGDIDPQTAYDLLLERANAYTAKNGFKALETIQEYMKTQEAMQEAIEKLKEYGIEYDPNGEADINDNLVNVNNMGAKTDGWKMVASAGASDVRTLRSEDYEYTEDEIMMLREEIDSGYGEDEYGDRVRLTEDEIAQKKKRLKQLEAIADGTASEEEKQAYDEEAAQAIAAGQESEQERAAKKAAHDNEIQQSIARQREINSLIATVSDSQEYLDANKNAYDSAVKTQGIMRNGYDSASALQGKNNSVEGGTAVLTAIETAVMLGSEYVPTNWTTASLYDLAESVADEQGYTHENIVDAARSGLEQNKLTLEQVNSMLDVLDENGVEISKEYRSNITRYQESLERDIKDAEYYLLRESSGFASTAQQEAEKVLSAYSDYNKIYTNPISGIISSFMDKDGYSTLDNAIAQRLSQTMLSRYSSVPLSEEAALAFAVKPGDGYDTADINQLSLEDCQTYMYILSTDGNDAAKEYYDHMTDETYGVINMRRNLSFSERVAAFADENGTTASILSVLASPFRLAGTLKSVIDAASGREINPYSSFNMPSQGISAARSTVKENINNDLGGGFLGWVGSLGYDVAMSVGDSMVNSTLFGGVGQGAGSTAANVLSKTSIRPEMIATLSGMVASFTTSSFMGASAAGDTIMSAKMNGANNTEAFLLGGVSYLAETVSETIELESVDAMVHLGKEREFRSAVSKLLYGMLNESIGEGTSEFVESVADRIVLDTRSDWQATVDEYREQGYTEDTAKALAWRNVVANSLTASLSGALSSGVHAGIGYAKGVLQSDQQYQQSMDEIEAIRSRAFQDAQAEIEQQQAQETPVQQTETPESEQVAMQTAQETAQGEQEQAQELETDAGQTTEQAEEKTAQTQNKAKEKQSDSVTRQVMVLNEALGADDASKTASIAAVLLGDGTSVEDTGVASAAAQYMSQQLGSEDAVRVVRDMILTDADMQGTSIALKTAALNEGGSSSQILKNMAANGVTAEQIAQMKQAALVELSAPDTVRQMQQKVFDNQVAMRTAQLISDGALNAVQPYEEAVDQAKSTLKQAKSDLSKQKKRQKALGENLRSLQAEMNSSEYSPQKMDLFRQTVKDLEGQNKVVKEYEQRKANAEEALSKANNKLDAVRDETLGTVRQQALTEVQEAYASIQEQQAAQQAAGKKGVLYTNDNESVGFHYALVEEGSLITSNTENMEVNPAYPQELQPRDRQRSASQQQVDEIASNLNPARLGESTDAQTGAPVVGADNIVESGNGRVMAIRSAMQKGKSGQYTQWLKENAQTFGIDPAQITDTSILVRVRDTDVDRASFVRKSNESVTSSYSQTENAKNDAEKLTPEILNLFDANENGEVNTKANAAFLTRFVSEIIPESDRGAYLQADGTLSQNGINRVRNALFQKAYGSTTLTAALSESTDEGTKNVVRALTNVAPRIASITAAIQEGSLYDRDIASDLAQAAEQYRSLKKQGIDISDYQAQFRMPGYESETPTAAAFMSLFDKNRRNSSRITEAINNVLDTIEGYGDPKQINMLGDVSIPSTEEIVQNAVDHPNSNIRYSYGKTGVNGSDTGSAKQETVTNPIQIVKNLADKLQVGASLGTRKTRGGIPKNAIGYYERQIGHVTVRSGHAGDYETSMHEIGHAIAEKTGLTGTQEMINRLSDDFKEPYGFDLEILQDEAFAEFVSLYMRDSNAAENFVGSAYVNEFENALRKAGIADAVHTARDQMQTYLAATTAERASSYIVDKADAYGKNTLAEKMRTFITNWQSWSYPVERVDAAARETNDGEYGNLRLLAKRRNFTNQRVGALINTALTTPDGEMVDGSFAKCFEEIKVENADTAKEVLTYWLMKHSLDRDRQGEQAQQKLRDSGKQDQITGHEKQVFASDITFAAREQEVAKIESEHPEYKDAVEKASKWITEFTQYWLVNTGYMDQETHDTLAKIYPYYLPTRRVMDGGSGRGAKDSYTIREAKGSDLQILNPIEVLADNMTRIVGMVFKNDVNVEFNRLYQQGGLGAFAREITSDMQKVSVDTKDVRNKVQKILQGAKTETDVMDAVLEAIGEHADAWKSMHGSSEGNVLQVRLPDGSDVYYQFTPQARDVYKALSGNGKAAHQDVKHALHFINTVTGFVSKANTSWSLVFPTTNAIKDQINAINYGTYAKTGVDGLYKWCKSFYQVTRGSDTYNQYLAMGGGGYTRIDTSTKKGADDYMGMLFKGYNMSSPKRAVRTVANAVLDIVTAEQLQDWIETTTRFTEFAYGNHDLTTGEGLTKAFQAAQNVTTDFADSGDGVGLTIAKAFIPYLNANIQGNARAINEFSGRQRNQLAPRMIKRAVNSLIMTGIAAVSRELLLSDKDKELYAQLSDDMKLQYYVLPNFINKDSDRRFIRIPVSMDPYDMLFHTLGVATTESVTGTDNFGALLKGGCANLLNNMTYDLADVVLEDGDVVDKLNAFMSGTVVSPLWAAITNKNYYGGDIVSDYLKNYKSPEMQYNDSTNDMFISLGQRIGVSPIMLQYMFEQTTGYGGTLLLSSDFKISNIGSAIAQTFHKRFTIDPAYSNDISGAYAENKSSLKEFKQYVSSSNTDSKFLRSDLSETERKQAYEDAKAMFAKDGLFTVADERIGECWDEINALREDTSITDAARKARTLELRDEIVEIQLEANEKAGEFYAKYVTGDTWFTKLLNIPQTLTPFTTYEKLDAAFLADANKDYMAISKAVWEATGKDSALPHPNTSFKVGDTTYDIEAADWDEWVSDYKAAYEDYIATVKWDDLATDDERLNALTKAHNKGHAAAKENYATRKGISLK